MNQQKKPLEDIVKSAFQLLFDVEYKKTSKFFIEMYQMKGSNSKDILSQKSNPIELTQINIKATKNKIEPTFPPKEQIEYFQQQTKYFRVITTLNLQCSAHGVFNKFKLGKTFLDFFQSIFSYQIDSLKIKKLKLNLSGFNLNTNKKLYKIRFEKGQKLFEDQQCNFSFIKKLKSIIQKKKDQLQQIELRINNVRYCEIRDLKDVLQLGFFDSKTKQSGNKLTNLSLELSDWMFYQIAQNQKAPQNKGMNESSQKINQIKTQIQCQTIWLTMADFKDVMFSLIHKKGKQIKDNKLILMPQMKRLRLQLSTLCYEKESCEKFVQSIDQNEYKNTKLYLKNKKVTQPIQYFHYLMIQFIKNIAIEVMPKLTSLELDFRNWYQNFQMKQLKDELVNINRKYELQVIKNENEKAINNQNIRQSRLRNTKRNSIEQPKSQIGTITNVEQNKHQNIPLKIVAVI